MLTIALPASLLEGFAGDGVEPPRRAAVRTSPPVDAACAFTADDEDASHRTSAAVRGWMAARGLALIGPKREIYWPGMLEIQFPIAI